MTPIETAVEILEQATSYVEFAYECAFSDDKANKALLERMKSFIKEHKPPTRKFRKLPLEVEAIQFINGNHTDICNFVGSSRFGYSHGIGITITTLEGNMRVSDGDWVVKGIKGEFWPVKPDIFALTYEAVE